MRKGEKMTEEQKKTIGFKKGHSLKGFLGHKHSPEVIEKNRLKSLGKKASIETRQKMSKNMLGNKYMLGRHLSEETKQKLRESSTGKKHTEETKQKISNLYKGKGNPMFGKVGVNKGLFGHESSCYIQDRSKLKKLITPDRRLDSAMIEWRKDVYKRDNFKCKINNKDCKGRIEAHHILRWSEYVELRYDINNGITLCSNHHPRKKSEESRLSPYFKNLIKQI